MYTACLKRGVCIRCRSHPVCSYTSMPRGAEDKVTVLCALPKLSSVAITVTVLHRLKCNNILAYMATFWGDSAKERIKRKVAQWQGVNTIVKEVLLYKGRAEIAKRRWIQPSRQYLTTAPSITMNYSQKRQPLQIHQSFGVHLTKACW